MKLWTPYLIGSLFLGFVCLGADTHKPATGEHRNLPTALVAAQNPKVQAFMRRKLVAADQILEGLTVPDMALVRKGATSMIHMNKGAMWATFKSPSYAQDSADFVRTAERLIKLTKADDIEAASYTYAQLTVQCVSCHRRVRSQGIVRVPRLSPKKVDTRFVAASQRIPPVSSRATD